MAFSSIITQTATQLGLRPLTNTLFYGMTDGWPILLGAYTLTVTTSDPGRYNTDQIKSADPMVKKVSYKDGKLTVAFRTKAKELVSPIRTVLAALASLGLEPTRECPICGQNGCDCAIFLKNEFRLAHMSCLETLDSDAAQTKESGEHGSLLLGILGALLGMIVGTLPNTFTILSMEMEYSILFALIPICAYFGYKLLHGKMKRPIPLIVSVIMSVLGVFILMFEVTTIAVMKELEIETKEFFTVLGILIKEPEMWSAIFTDSFQEFLFTALGLLVAWRIIASTPAETAQNVAATAKMSVYLLKAPDEPEEIGEETHYGLPE